MDNLIEKIKEYIMEECRKYKEASEDHYNTIKSVVLGDMQESKTSQYSMD